MKRKRRVLVAMSGGIDSALAACLLKRRGYYVVGATMKLWPKEHCDEHYRERACCSLKGIEDARDTAAKLDIPYYVFDFHDEFKKNIIDYFCGEYARGHTPNPCIMCNQKIKFGIFLKKAKELGCEHIATGHYAKIGYNRFTKRYYIREGRDRKKDQSYFLSFVPQQGLANIIFPLGNITKTRARRLARNFGLKVHDKVSSQEICFVPEHYADYIKTKNSVNLREGDVVDVKGRRMGRHRGIPLYTIGQRKRLGIAHKEPLYVTAIDREKNTITVGTKQEIMKRDIILRDPYWASVKDISKPLRIEAKIRYGHAKAAAVVEKIDKRRLMVSFRKPQEAPTPGQAVAFYKNGGVLGAGWIDSVQG